MDKTPLVRDVAELFRLNGHSVQISVKINHREIDIVARELQGLIQKTILIECAEHAGPVGVEKIQEDLLKLRAAREACKESVVLVHVSRSGYTPDAGGYARDEGLSAFAYDDLVKNLVNFNSYIQVIEADRLRSVIMREYQPTTVFREVSGELREKKSALTFLDEWLLTEQSCLIVLGDYGVGKSWLLKRYLYELLDRYKVDSTSNPLPFFVPLQRFTKAFDFQNLILKTFESYGLSGVHYDAFQFLVRTGRVVLLLDSFDEMAQHLGRMALRENIATIFDALSGSSKAIITSRPNYFENRAERILLVDRYDVENAHELDRAIIEQQIRLTNSVARNFDKTDFARLDDLTPSQRAKLFTIVLGDKPAALAKLTYLLKRFNELNSLSQRAVIARLLTTVAETLAAEENIETVEGFPLLPEDIAKLNQAKVFEIVVYNLLSRDQGIGQLSANDRYRFLKRFAVYLQRRESDFFASPDEIKELVREIFSTHISLSDTPEQDFENIYRTCRRHSGLTTESQFYDTSGVIDLPVSDADVDSRVGFSHNSLREYLVAASAVDAVKSNDDEAWRGVLAAGVTDVVKQFIIDISEYQPQILENLSKLYLESEKSNLIEFAFNLLWYLISKSPSQQFLLGTPVQLHGVDLSLMDLTKLNLNGARIVHSILQDTKLSGTDLRNAVFDYSIIEQGRFDGAELKGCDFERANVLSIHVFDEFDSRTSGILKGDKAAQWLFSHDAKVADSEKLNPLIGKPWYEAAREVTRTLEKRLRGTHQKRSLAKGTPAKYRPLANEFVEFLVQKGVLVRVVKSDFGGGWVVKLDPSYQSDIIEFSQRGRIGDSLKPFFQKHGLT